MSDSPAVPAAEFSSVYGQLMALSGHLSDDQMSALRELDETLRLAEHVMAGTPVGAGAHSTICGMIMNSYAAGRASERERIRRELLNVVTANVTAGNDTVYGALLDAIRELGQS